MAKNCTETFDWIIYRDATLAGLAALLPVPYVDDAIEGRFRRQMPTSIAARRGTHSHRAQYRRSTNALPRGRGSRKVLSLAFKAAAALGHAGLAKGHLRISVRRTVEKLAALLAARFLLDYMICNGDIGAEQGNERPATQPLKTLRI